MEKNTREARRLLAGALAAAALLGTAARADDGGAATQRLRIVGGLAGVNQYTRHEEPFWTRDLARLSGGRASAEIVPFDRAGLRGAEMLQLVQIGAVPFGTAILSASSGQDPELTALDLAGLNPDVATLTRAAAAFRPHLRTLLHERYGIELLAVYVYPAQVTFCTRALSSLADLAGRRVRVSGASQADWVGALGATPVKTGFAEIAANLKSGNIDCAITGTMSGNTIGLHQLTSHVHTMPINWGVAVFVANGSAWAALDPDLRALLQRELPRLEERIWSEAARETGEGIACNIGADGCSSGRKGSMTPVPATAEDAVRRREILMRKVLPAWIQRCGAQCARLWRQTLGPATGIDLQP